MEAAPRVPMWLKLAYTAFMAIFLPVYWYHYGPTNFLYFCDVSLLVTLAGIWLDSPLIISIAAVGILGSQALWILDFAVELAGGHLTGMTSYMFDTQRPLYLRALSLFHGWLPFLLIYLVRRLGYDRRGFWRWTILAWALILTCFFFLPPPSLHHGIRPVNVNYVYGFSDDERQHWVPQGVWLIVEMIALPAVLYLPAHFLLRSGLLKRRVALVPRTAEGEQL